MKIRRILPFLAIARKKAVDLQNQNHSSTTRRQVFLQVVFALSANLATISTGMGLGFSAVALPQLQNENATFHIDESQASWTASLASISTIIGSLISGDMMDRFGRKATILSINVPGLLGWLLIAFADGKSTLAMIYAGRFITGLAYGLINVPTVYSAEMATDSLRGMFINWTSAAVSIGILLVYILGFILQENWRLLAGICAIFPVCAFVLEVFTLPETPSWLLIKGKKGEAEKALKKIRGIRKSDEMPPSVQKEFQILTDKYDKKTGQVSDTPQKNIKQLIFSAATIKPFIIMNFFFLFQQFSGIYVIIYYAVNITEIAGVSWDPYLVTIAIGLTRFLLVLVISFISRRCGRRLPSIVSGAGMTICMGTLAIFLYLQSIRAIAEDTAKTLTWVPATCLVLYILTSTIGFLPMPWAMIGEVFPLEVRGVAVGVTSCIAEIFNFVSIKTYPDMLHAFNDYGVFFFYGAVSAVGTVFVALFLPETEGKSLQEIEESFSKKKKSEQTRF